MVRTYAVGFSLAPQGLLLALLALLPSSCTTSSEHAWHACEQGRYDVAIHAWKPQAARGDIGSQYLLGLMYDEGRGVERDYAEAAR